eukprot:3934496-Rhodomonas_salina.2
MPPPRAEARLSRTVSVPPVTCIARPCAKTPPPSRAKLREKTMLPSRAAVERSRTASAPPSAPATHASRTESCAISVDSPCTEMPPPFRPAAPRRTEQRLISADASWKSSVPPSRARATLDWNSTRKAAKMPSRRLAVDASPINPRLVAHDRHLPLSPQRPSRQVDPSAEVARSTASDLDSRSQIDHARVQAAHPSPTIPSLVVHDRHRPFRHQNAFALQEDPSSEIASRTSPDLSTVSQIDHAREKSANASPNFPSLVPDDRHVPFCRQRAFALQVDPSAPHASNTASDLDPPSHLDRTGPSAEKPSPIIPRLVAHNRHAPLRPQRAFTLQVDPAAILACNTAPDLRPPS